MYLDRFVPMIICPARRPAERRPTANTKLASVTSISVKPRAAGFSGCNGDIAHSRNRNRLRRRSIAQRKTHRSGRCRNRPARKELERRRRVHRHISPRAPWNGRPDVRESRCRRHLARQLVRLRRRTDTDVVVIATHDGLISRALNRAGQRCDGGVQTSAKTIIPSATTNDISNNVNPLLRRAIFSKPLVRNMETHSRNATPNRIAPYAQRFEHFTQKSVLPSCNEFGARSFLRQMKNNLAKCQ